MRKLIALACDSQKLKTSNMSTSRGVGEHDGLFTRWCATQKLNESTAPINWQVFATE